MNRKFKLRNERQQHLATVLYFYEEEILSYVGIIFNNDLSEKIIWLYNNETINNVIHDLANRINMVL